MAKRRGTLTNAMLSDTSRIRDVDYSPDELRNFDRLISSAVSRCLVDDDLSRLEMAELLSSMLGEKVSAFMLDAYASEARREHAIPAHRFLALVAATRRFDVLDAILREAGGRALNRQSAELYDLGVAYLHRELQQLRVDKALARIIPEELK